MKVGIAHFLAKNMYKYNKEIHYLLSPPIGTSITSPFASLFTELASSSVFSFFVCDICVFVGHHDKVKPHGVTKSSLIQFWCNNSWHLPSAS